MDKESKATVLAFLIAPLVPVVAMGIMSLPNTGSWEVFLGIAAIVYINVCVFTLIIGFPTYHLLKKKNLVRWWVVSLVGLTAGAVVGYAYRLPFYPDRYQSGLAQGVGCGLAGIVFWAIWRTGQRAT